jgi:hypothetical protein
VRKSLHGFVNFAGSVLSMHGFDDSPVGYLTCKSGNHYKRDTFGEANNTPFQVLEDAPKRLRKIGAKRYTVFINKISNYAFL